MLDSLRMFNDKEKRTLLAHGTRHSIPRNWAPLMQGTGPDKVYLLLAGTALVKRNGAVIARVGAGELLGENALHRNGLRNATVVAETDLDVLQFSPNSWQNALDKVPSLGALLHSTLARREGTNIV